MCKTIEMYVCSMPEGLIYSHAGNEGSEGVLKHVFTLCIHLQYTQVLVNLVATAEVKIQLYYKVYKWLSELQIHTNGVCMVFGGACFHLFTLLLFEYCTCKSDHLRQRYSAVLWKMRT